MRVHLKLGHSARLRPLAAHWAVGIAEIEMQLANQNPESGSLIMRLQFDLLSPQSDSLSPSSPAVPLTAESSEPTGH